MKMKKKREQILKKQDKRNWPKAAIQILSFLLLPGLFEAQFSAVGTIVSAVYQGTVSWERIRYSVWMLLATVPAVIIVGRFFCGYFCKTFSEMDSEKLQAEIAVSKSRCEKPAFKFKEEWKKCSNRLDQIWCTTVLGSLCMERYIKMEHRRAVAGVWAVQFHRTLAGREADVFDWRCAASGDFRRIRLNPALFLPVSLSHGSHLQPDFQMCSVKNCKTAEQMRKLPSLYCKMYHGN